MSPELQAGTPAGRPWPLRQQVAHRACSGTGIALGTPQVAETVQMSPWLRVRLLPRGAEAAATPSDGHASLCAVPGLHPGLRQIPPPQRPPCTASSPPRHSRVLLPRTVICTVSYKLKRTACNLLRLAFFTRHKPRDPARQSGLTTASVSSLLPGTPVRTHPGVATHPSQNTRPLSRFQLLQASEHWGTRVLWTPGQRAVCVQRVQSRPSCLPGGCTFSLSRRRGSGSLPLLLHRCVFTAASLKSESRFTHRPGIQSLQVLTMSALATILNEVRGMTLPSGMSAQLSNRDVCVRRTESWTSSRGPRTSLQRRPAGLTQR